MILVGSYFKDVHTGEGRERTPLGVNQGILISSNGMIIKVEECRLECTQPLCAVSAVGAAPAPRQRWWSSAHGSGAGGPAGDGGPLQLLMAGVSRRALPGTLRHLPPHPGHGWRCTGHHPKHHHRGAGTADTGRQVLGHPLQPSPGQRLCCPACPCGSGTGGCSPLRYR